MIGRVVWAGAVAHVGARPRDEVDDRLRRLTHRELMRLQRESSVEHDDQYAFQHALIRDVAYSQIVRSARAGRHVRTAEWIESLGDDRGDRAEVLAHHYVTALALLRATGEDPGDLPQRARDALLEAADRALAISAFAAAASHYASAFALTPPPGPSPQLRWRWARACMYSEDTLPDDLPGIARELADAGDLESAAEAEGDVGIWLDQHGGKEDALEHLERAVSLLRDRPSSPAKASALTSLASVLVLGGRLDEALSASGEALEIAIALGLDDLRAWSHQTTALALLQQGDARAGEEFEQAVAIARHMESYDGAMIEHNYGVWLLALGALRRASDAQAAARLRATRLGLAYTARLVDGTLMCIAYHTGDWETSERIASRQLDLGGRPGDGSVLDALTVRARIRLARGEDGRAREDAAQALALARELGEPQYLVTALSVAAHLHVLDSADDEGAALVEELLGGPWMGVGISAEALASAGFAASRLPSVRDAFARQAASYPLPHAWVAAAGALAEGRWEHAAAAYAAIGSRADEAFAWMLAGDRARAAVFWETVGARAYAGNM